MSQDIAQFGIVVTPPNDGVNATVAGLRRMGAEAAATHAKVVSGSAASTGAFNKMATEAVRTSSATNTLLRTLGPLGGAATEMGVRMERAAMQGERLLTMASNQVSRQEVLTAAFNSGAIAAATMEAASARLTTSRATATAAELAYARAVAASRIALEESRIASANVREQRVVVSAAVATGTGGRFAFEEKASLEREQRRLTQAQNEAVVASNALRAAQTEERAVKQSMVAANRDLATAERTVAEASGAAASGFLATTAIVAAIVASLILLTGAIYGVKKAWDFTMESLTAAGKVQAAGLSLRNLIGDAEEAEKVLHALNQIELDTGVFDERSLNMAATQLYGIGVGLDDLVTRTRQLANVAAVLDRPIDATVSAYVRLVEMVGATGKLQARSLTQFAQQGFDVLLVLSQTTGKTRDEVARMVKEGEIGIKEVDRALEEFAKHDFLGQRARSWEGLWKRAHAIWEEVHEVFGRPIVDKLSPILERILGTGGKLSPQFETFLDRVGELGERVADVIGDLDKAAQESKFAETLALKMSQSLEDFAPIVARFLLDLQQQFARTTLKLSIKFVMGVNELVADVAKKAAAGAWHAFDNFGGVPSPNAAPLTYTPTNPYYGRDNVWNTDYGSGNKPRHQSTMPNLQDLGGRGRESDYDKVKTDLKAINDMWYEMSLIQAKVGDETERNRRINELFKQTSEDLYNPAAAERFVAQLEAQGVVNARLILQDAERIRKQKELDAAIKANTATIGESFVSGINKAIKAWGNFSEMVERTAQEITDALANDIAGGLTDILNGTKGVGEGFRDMALAIVEDIQRIIVKMLIQYAIQQLLGMFTGGGGSINTGALAAGGMASGGPVFGGSGSKDDVPIWAMAGEFMIRKDVVRAEGIDRMYALNAGAAHIQKMAGGGLVGPSSGSASPSSWSAAAASSSHTQISSPVVVEIHYHGDTGATETRTRGGDDRAEAAELAQAIEPIVTRIMLKHKRSGGINERRRA